MSHALREDSFRAPTGAAPTSGVVVCVTARSASSARITRAQAQLVRLGQEHRLVASLAHAPAKPRVAPHSAHTAACRDASTSSSVPQRLQKSGPESAMSGDWRDGCSRQLGRITAARAA